MAESSELGPRPLGADAMFIDPRNARPWVPRWQRSYSGSLTRKLDAATQEVGPWSETLWAVLRGMADQVGRVRRNEFAGAGDDPLSLSLVALAMAFKPTDTGVLGDVFEWAVFRSIAKQDPVVLAHLRSAVALAHPTVQISQYRVLMVAHERRQFGSVLAEAGASATLSTPGRGRNPLLSSVLAKATPGNWKGDLLIGDVDGRWVPLTLKYRSRDLDKISPHEPGLLGAPRIGVTLRPHRPGLSMSPVIRHNKHGLVIVELAAAYAALHGFGSVFRLLEGALTRDFAPPADLATRWAEEQQILLFLDRRKGYPIRDVLAELEQGFARWSEGPMPSTVVDLVWEEFDATAAGPAPSGSFFALDAIVTPDGWA